MNILLLKYNNYFNRIYKRLETVAEYQEVADAYSMYTNINFNPADGVETELIVGGPTQKEDDGKPLRWDTDGSPDYCLVLNNNEIISRWFVIECDRTRFGQYRTQLRRDVIADHINTVLNATAYIEKGLVSATSVLAFNKENIEFNQIKQSETLLKDKSNTPWLVGYIAKNADIDAGTSVSYDPEDEDYISVSAATINSWEYSNYQTNTFYSDAKNFKYKIIYRRGTNETIYDANYELTITEDGGTGAAVNLGASYSPALRSPILSSLAWWTDEVSLPRGVYKKLIATMQSMSLDSFKAQARVAASVNSVARTNDLLSYSGQTIQTQDGKFYNIDVKKVSSKKVSINIENANDTASLFNLLSVAAINSGAFAPEYSNADNNSFKLEGELEGYRVIITEMKTLSATVKVGTSRNKTKDSIYDIIATPLEALDIGTIDENGDFDKVLTTEKYVNINIMTTIAKQLSTSCYDLQVLPYCPIQSALRGETNQLVIDEDLEGKTYDYIKDDDDNILGCLFYVPEANFTFNIDCNIQVERPTNTISFNPIGSMRNLPKLGTLYVPKIAPIAAPVGYNRTIGMASFGNVIDVYKYNRTTFELVEQYKACSVSFYSNDRIEIKITYDKNNTINKETIGAVAYDSADYYLAFNFGAIKTYTVDTTLIPKMLCYKTYVYDNSEIVDIKIDNQCNMYRLVSPNYQSDFEFSVAKNNGVDYFNVDCTYKPYNPYIHLNPNFKNLYGYDFNDIRGLVLNGDFSFGMIGDAFSNYELNNKNFREIFDRQISNMDINNAINMQEAKIQSVVGTIQGGAAGAGTGAIMGGPVGGAIGGIAGTMASGIGGAADILNLQRRQQEQRNFSIDMYNYNIRTIQARPYSISKCSALTFNNKLYPFVEKYSCTDEEKEIFKNKLHYDGMTVMAIGKISDYTIQDGTLVRGDIIRLDLKDETHMANAIHQEILKGVYL